jgi:hypothetical protein
MIRQRKKTKGNKMIKKYILLVSLGMFYTSASYAEKVECDLLSPIQKKIYKAYCQAEAKKSGNVSSSTDGALNKAKDSVGGIFKKLKLNTDSKLLKTGKYSK